MQGLNLKVMGPKLRKPLKIKLLAQKVFAKSIGF